MKYGPIRSVVIDDKPTHLLAIAAGLSSVGIPCMSYWYDKGKNALIPTPKEPHRYLRLIFSDLNLAEIAGNPTPEMLEAVIEDVLKQLVSPDGGPYVLVFWTEVARKANKVGELLFSRLAGIPKPLHVIELKKGPFLSKASGNPTDLESALESVFSELATKLPELGREITRISEVKPELNLVAEWESRAIEAAASTVNEIVAHARKDAADDTQVGETLKKVLAFIARSAAGSLSATNDPARALDAGMTEILSDQFSVSASDKQYRNLVRAALSTVISADPVFNKPSRIAAALNTFYHIDSQVKGAETVDRGVVIAGGNLVKASDLGMSRKRLLQDEFLHPPSNPAERLLFDALPGEATFVVIEAGADCDHAQPKPRTLRYLVGYLIPRNYVDLILRGKNKGNKKPRFPSLICLGPWLINGAEVHLIVSMRRFFTWQRRESPSGKVKFRLRSSVVNKLLHDYSTWHSRPGIVEFRP